MSLLRWIWAYLFDCVHIRTTWPHQNRFGHAYVCCLDCGKEMPYSVEYMRVVEQTDRSARKASPDAPQEVQISVVPAVARKMLAGVILLGTILASQQKANAVDHTSHLNVQTQAACETETLSKINAREVFSGRAYDVLTEVARAYGRGIPHIYIFPGSWNMAYIAASIAVDGRGKFLVGQQATDLFDTAALKGFLGHEMAHLVSDTVAQGCNDYIVRDPKMEADADALAARTIGRRPVKAFLERALALTENQNWDARRRLEILQRFQLTKVSEKPNDDTRVR
jgi:hypothetical protein